MYRIEEELGKTTTLKVTDKGHDYSLYRASYDNYDDSIDDGITCTDYNKLGSSFGECFQKDIDSKIMEWIGCIPMWFPENMSKCDVR